MRAEEAACWVASMTFWLMDAARLREPLELEKLSAEVVEWPAPPAPPITSGPSASPKPPPPSSVVAELSACEKPLWTSLATASCTSLTARLWVVRLLSCSVSEIDSDVSVEERRDQSSTAMRVLSPGARASECRRLPSAKPCADHDCSKVSRAPIAGAEKPKSALSAGLRSTGPAVVSSTVFWAATSSSTTVE